jgi:hypothetical protein
MEPAGQEAARRFIPMGAASAAGRTPTLTRRRGLHWYRRPVVPKCWRSIQVAAILALAAALGTGCGDSEESNGIELSGATARDERIAAHLGTYIERNYGNAERPASPPENLSPLQQRAFAELSDNVAELQGSIERISVNETVITVETSLGSDDEGLQTARLICTVIYGADVADLTKGHRIVGLESAPLVECSPETNPLK